MSKKILTLAITMCIASASMMHANAQADKNSTKARKDVKEAHRDVQEANKNLDEAKRDLKTANADSTADYLAFKKEAEASIAKNKQTIAQLKSKKWNADTKSKEKYNKQIIILERKNNKLQMEMNTANHTNSTKWDSFKREFKHDMNELGNALRDLGVDNAN